MLVYFSNTEDKSVKGWDILHVHHLKATFLLFILKVLQQIIENCKNIAQTIQNYFKIMNTLYTFPIQNILHWQCNAKL